MIDNLNLSEECQNRVKGFQIACGDLMSKKRGVVDDETFDMLSEAYAISGNAAREISLLIVEIRELRKQLTQK